MSLIFSESFDLLTPAQLVTSGKWAASTSGLAGPTGVVGRNGYAWGAQTTTTNLSKLFSTADQHGTLIVGMARYFASAFSAHDVISLWGDSGTTQHITLYINANRQLEVYRGSSGGTLLGATPLVDALALSTWYYIELKALLNDTAGTIDVRINGVNKLSLSAIDTKNAGTATVFNYLRVHLTPNNSNDKADDLYVCNGAGSVNNDFLGDMRIETLTPNADGTYSQWTARSYNRLQSANVSGIETDATGWASDANCSVARVTTPVHSGSGALQVTPTVNGTTMSVKTAGGTSGFVVTPSTAYVLGAYARTASTIRAVNVGVEWYDAAGATISRTLNSPALNDPTSYTLFQPTVAYTSPVNAAFAALLVQWVTPSEIHYLDDAFVMETTVTTAATAEAGTLSTHYTATTDYSVAATANTQDESYVVSSTNDQIDTWAHTNPISPTTVAVKGVVQYAEARADTASAKSLALVAITAPVPDFRVATGATNSATITIPAAVVTGDLMLIAHVAFSAPSTPAGWTLVRSDQGLGSNSMYLTIFSRVATGGDTGGSTTVTVGAANTSIFVAYYGTGLALSATQGSNQSGGDGTTLTAPSITTVNPARVIEFFGFKSNPASTPSLSALPVTSRGNYASGASEYAAVSVSDQSHSGGATSTKTATNALNGAWVATTLAVTGSATLASADYSLAQTYGIVAKAWETDPTANPWTVANVTAAEFGCKVRP